MLDDWRSYSIFYQIISAVIATIENEATLNEKISLEEVKIKILNEVENMLNNILINLVYDIS